MNRRAWSLAPVSALVSLGLGLLALWLILPLAYPDSFDPSDDPEPLVLPAQDFNQVTVAMWLSGVTGDIEIPANAAGRSIQVAGVRLDADRYPQMALDLNGLSANASVYLLWRTAESPEAVTSTELHGVTEGESWHSLADSAEWRGSVSAIGLMAISPRPATLRLSGVSFHGASRRALVERSWSQWSRFHPWKMSSPNRYSGARGDVILHPTTAFSVWSSVSLLIFVFAAWRLRMPRPAIAVGALMVLFLPWFGLDRLWQSQLHGQVEATRGQFGGLTQARKHEREMDAEIQRYAARIARVLPSDEDDRVFILHESRGHKFWRLRLQFHLLPTNIHNFGHQLLPEMQPGDYAVLLGEFEDLRFEAGRGVLGDGERAWQAELVDRHPYGRVYRLESRVDIGVGEEGE